MGIKEIRDNRARWDALIRIRVADEPDVKAYRVGKDLADLNSKLTEPIPADEPSQRTTAMGCCAVYSGPAATLPLPAKGRSIGQANH